MDDYQLCVDEYTNGCCMYLAAALHHYYGLPLGMLVNPSTPLDFILHAWVTTPDGKCFDIQGKKTLEEMIKQFGSRCETKVCQPTTIEELADVCGVKLDANNHNVLEALEVANRYLRAELDLCEKEGQRKNWLKELAKAMDELTLDDIAGVAGKLVQDKPKKEKNQWQS